MRSALHRAGRYLQGRQCPQGGFCFYRSEYLNEPNLSDTFHAVSALALLRMSPTDGDRLLDDLHSIPVNRQPWDLYHLTQTLRVLDPSYQPDRTMRLRIAGLDVGPAPEKDSILLTGWLSRALVVTQLHRECGIVAGLAEIGRTVTGLLHDGGFGPGPNLADTCAAIELLRSCGATPVLPGLTEFVDRLQRMPFGFEATVGSSRGQLELLHAGVVCCRTLGLPVRHGRNVLAFALACQARSGGFADASGALADIASTHRAVELVLALEPALALTDAATA